MESIQHEVAHLQDRIAVLIVENEEISHRLESFTLNSNEIINYLKKKVEDQDDDIARLEETMDYRESQIRNRYEMEANRLKDEQEKWEKEKLDLIAQVAIIKTQLGLHQRMCFELAELTEKNNQLKLSLNRKIEDIEKQKADFEIERKRMKDILRIEMRNNLMIEMEDMRSELELQKETAIKTNRKIIEKLEEHIAEKSLQFQAIEEKKSQLQEIIKDREDRNNILVEENTKIRKLLEKSGKSAEKQLRDAHRQAEDAEKRRLRAIQESKEIINQLKSELNKLYQYLLLTSFGLKEKKDENIIKELEEKFIKKTKLCESYEKVVLKEQSRREAILLAHASQNEKLKQLKEFLLICLKDQNNPSDDVIGEDRHAIFSKLSLIISQIPIVK